MNIIKIDDLSILKGIEALKGKYMGLLCNKDDFTEDDITSADVLETLTLDDTDFNDSYADCDKNGVNKYIL